MCRFLCIGQAYLSKEQGAGEVFDPTSGFTVTAQWTIGPRTAKWDELWRRIVFAALDNPDAPTGDFMADQPTSDCRTSVKEEEIDA